MQKQQQLAQLGIPMAERVLLSHIVGITKGLYAGLSWSGAGREVWPMPRSRAWSWPRGVHPSSRVP